MTDTRHPVDVHVGARILSARKQRGITQQSLAAALNLTFQQVQKYERGMNRVSASKLFEIARHLNMPISAFFDGLEGHQAVRDVAGDPLLQMAYLHGGQKLAADFVALPEPARANLVRVASEIREAFDSAGQAEAA